MDHDKFAEKRGRQPNKMRLRASEAELEALNRGLQPT
jgi:hypothetical protein